MYTGNDTWFICQSCADQFVHFKVDVTCVLLVAAIPRFTLLKLVADLPLIEKGRLPILVHLLGTLII